MINSNINFIREMRRRKYWKGLVREDALENGAAVIKSKDRNLDEIRKLIKNNVNKIRVPDDDTNEYEIYFE